MEEAINKLQQTIEALGKSVKREHNIEGEMDELKATFATHERECATRAGEINTRFAELEGRINTLILKVDSNTKVMWVIFSSLISAFAFGIVGYIFTNMGG